MAYLKNERYEILRLENLGKQKLNQILPTFDDNIPNFETSIEKTRIHKGDAEDQKRPMEQLNDSSLTLFYLIHLLLSISLFHTHVKNYSMRERISPK